MSSTSVHLPSELVAQLDHVAASRGVSRNRVIVEACEELVARERGTWPAGFFDRDDLDDDALRELREGGQEMEAAIYRARHDRPVPPL